ncbi:hypothetical protein JAAARDRAFT_193674 [Jaapia argillacea MUCL 33604]|uniref:Uncharacterized protein n=1 Tax=Jaapia argillacea MUCL 33604 TaxID=933084 RepID=A0A067Q429_9AGAM|nr:hypothetical protein JAAARDRAFT_193674 [Jaapia argillacea MUCL 33604]
MTTSLHCRQRHHLSTPPTYNEHRAEVLLRKPWVVKFIQLVQQLGSLRLPLLFGTELTPCSVQLDKHYNVKLVKLIKLLHPPNPTIPTTPLAVGMKMWMTAKQKAAREKGDIVDMAAMHQCSECGVCGTLITDPCGTCKRLAAKESAGQDPQNPAAEQRRHRIEGRLG